jgi:hypothetical protein
VCLINIVAIAWSSGVSLSDRGSLTWLRALPSHGVFCLCLSLTANLHGASLGTGPEGEKCNRLFFAPHDRFGSGTALSATSADGPLLLQLQPSCCTAANWRSGPESAVSRCSKNPLSTVSYFHLVVWCSKTAARLNDTMPCAAMLCSKSKMLRNVSFLPWPASTVSGDQGPVHRGDDPCPISVKPCESEHRY